MKTVITVLAATAVAVASSGTAHADGQLDASEADYVASAGLTICSVISQRVAEEDVLAMADTITKDGFSDDSAVDIINASVREYCPQFWPLLVSMGKKSG